MLELPRERAARWLPFNLVGSGFDPFIVDIRREFTKCDEPSTIGHRSSPFESDGPSGLWHNWFVGWVCR